MLLGSEEKGNYLKQGGFSNLANTRIKLKMLYILNSINK